MALLSTINACTYTNLSAGGMMRALKVLGRESGRKVIGTFTPPKRVSCTRSDDMAKDGISRRHFFFGTLLAGAIPAAGWGSVPSLKMLGYKSPNEKLNIAAIGAGGRASSDIAGVSSENIIAFADPDSTRAAGSFQKY